MTKKKSTMSLSVLTVMFFMTFTTASAQDPMLGEVRIFAGNYAPRGWSKCEGQLLAISQNSALFAILGTTYGGDGRTTFALPDLRGRAAVSAGRHPGSNFSWRQGQVSGQETTTMTVLQMPSHSHTATVANGSVAIPVNATAGEEDEANPAGGFLANTGQDLFSSDKNGTYSGAPIATTSGAVTINPTGGSRSANNIQPILVLNYIIALQGYFPSRN